MDGRRGRGRSKRGCEYQKSPRRYFNVSHNHRLVTHTNLQPPPPPPGLSCFIIFNPQGMLGEPIQEQLSSSETVGVPAVRTVSAPETGRQTPVTQLNADLHIAAVAAAEGAPPSALATVVAAAMQAPPPPITRVSLMLGGSTEHLTDSSENGNSPARGGPLKCSHRPRRKRGEAGF